MKSNKFHASPFSLFLVFFLVGIWILPGLSGSSSAWGEDGKIFVSLAGDTTTWSNDSLFIINPDGTGKTKIFDFSGNTHAPSGSIVHPRIGNSGQVFFSSNNAYLWTPARRNLFRISVDGAGRDQITPDRNSGLWDQPGPYGTVEVTVLDGVGNPVGGAQVFVEGMSLKNANPSGVCLVENVPEGVRYVVAYRTYNGKMYFDAQPVTVIAGNTYRLTVTPNTGIRTNFEYPAVYGNRIYYKLWPDKIEYTGLNGTDSTTVYTSSACNYGPGAINGFDVGPFSGQILFTDYMTGCEGHIGLYTADKDGNNLRPVADFKSGNKCGVHDVFWSPDEKMIALTACNDWHYGFIILNGAMTEILGQGWFNTQYNPDFIKFRLHGWSPDGKWLLYSLYDGDPAQAILNKIGVNADGSLNVASETTLMTGAVHGAAWGLTDCLLVNSDLNLHVSCALFKGTKYSFLLNHFPNQDDPAGLYWKMDLSTFKTGGYGTCVDIGNDVSLQVACIQVLGGQYALTLSYYKNPKDPSGIYWKLDSITPR